MNKIIYAAVALLAGFHSLSGAAPAVKSCKVDGYVGDRIDACINGRVMAQDVDILVEPFRHLTEGDRWQMEFIGKWMLGAIDTYRYQPTPELLAKITDAAVKLMDTQQADGYIGNYKIEDRLKQWDVWGRKYCALSLLDYYRLTGDKRALTTVERLIDDLINDLASAGTEISATGNYRGMASCSILEPTVYLYRLSGKEKYLDFAKSIVESIEREGNSQLVTKGRADIPVAHRFEFPKQWWSYENGHKADEIMSCYVGLMELGNEIGNPSYLEAAIKTADNIIRNEINIAGSGAAFECWGDWKTSQTTPAYHTMETCVTFTWMQYLSKLLEQTGNPHYADEFERTMYNALMASLRADGGQISKYSPLEGRRVSGEEQCGLPINCCNANGPRGFALIPDFATRVSGDTIFVNLYVPQNATYKIGKNEVSVAVESKFPVTGENTLTITQSKPGKGKAVIALRIPGWCKDKYNIAVQSTEVSPEVKNGYAFINLGKSKTNTITADFALESRVEERNGMQAVVRGPLVFARDSRYADGYVDECCVIQASPDGVVETRFADSPADFAWITLEVPAILGTDLENHENSTPRYVKFCDFGSAGNDWARDGRYRVWLVKTIHAMSEPYRKY